MKVLLLCLALNPIYMLAQTNRISEEISKIPHDNMRPDTYSDGSYLCDSMIGYMFNTVLDSSINSKYVYSYDVNGNTTTYSYYNWDDVFNQWIIIRSDTTVYSLTGKIETQNRYSWNLDTKKLSSGWSMKNVYDSYGNQIIHTEFILDTSSNEFVNLIKTESFYNLSDVSDSSINYGWDSSKGTWIITSKWKTTANYVDDLMVSQEQCVWDTLNDQWIKTYKYEYDYDTDGNIVLYFTYSWDQNASEWIYSTKFELLFNEFGIATVLEYYDWDKINNQWEGIWKTEDSYDNNGNRILFINYDWDKTSYQWVNYNKVEYFYNSNGKEIVILSSVWNNSSDEWMLHGKDELFYDENGCQYLTIYYSWIEEYNQWHIGSKYYSYYSLHNNGVNVLTTNNNLDNIRIYPNPVKERIYIEIKDLFVSSVQIFNIRGQLIKTFNISLGLNTYDIDDLDTGIYILKVFTNDDEMNYKILKVD